MKKKKKAKKARRAKKRRAAVTVSKTVVKVNPRRRRNGLVAAKYGRALVDADDPFFHLIPKDGGYRVEDHGEAVGSIKKLKSGWTMRPTWAAGRHKQLLERGMALVDASRPTSNPTKYVVSRPRKKVAKRKEPRKVRASDGTKLVMRKRNPPRRRQTNTAYVSRDGAELRAAVSHCLAHARHNDPPARCSAAYWRMPRAARAANLRRLSRGDARSKRAAACIAKAEAGRGGPPKRNPMTDGEAIAEYERTHWGDRGRRTVRQGHAPDPARGTLTKMGKLIAVTYETRKKGDGGTAHYEHEFEGPLPTLAYNEGGLVVVGGAYRIAKGGITG